MATFWKNNRGIIVFLFLMMFFRTAVADWYHVPSGSMQPNILIGDRVWVNKLAYDIKVPLLETNLSRHHEPQSGDIVVFQSAQAGERLIKRVVGIPGDKIYMVNNRLNINGRWLDSAKFEEEQSFDKFMQDRDVAVYFEEESTGISKQKKYPIRIQSNTQSALSSFSAVTVPEEYLLVLGDNRDNSADSRVIGMIPRAELIGRAESVVISFDADRYYRPREGRYWQVL